MGQVCIVTGASRGIGRAVAEALAGSGAIVVMAARDADVLDEVSSGIAARGGKAIAVPTDVADENQVSHLFATAATIGPVRALITAAAILRKGAFDQMSIDDWKQVVDVNLQGTYLCCREAFRMMRSTGGGKIVTLSSLSGVYGTEKFPGLSAYNVSKYGVIGLTESLAVEGRAHGITAICVSPGAVDTEMLRQAGSGLIPGLRPHELAELLVDLIEGDNAAMSGTNILLFSNA
ncbi:MAG: SDR family NAD(P)-dependent oxidoreductase [Actinomycetota bacterium]